MGRGAGACAVRRSCNPVDGGSGCEGARRWCCSNHLYEVKLRPQDQVTFAAAPGKKNPRAGSQAGLLTFKLPSSGSYRVAIDMPFYIDVVSNGALVAATDFQGQRGCSSPHKIVEYDLSGTRPFLLQLSNADPDTVRLTITATPARKF